MMACLMVGLDWLTVADYLIRQYRPSNIESGMLARATSGFIFSCLREDVSHANFSVTAREFLTSLETCG